MPLINPDKLFAAPAMPTPETYHGGKGNSGVTERLINTVPPIHTLFVPFAGHCALTRKIRRVHRVVLFDLDPDVCQWWKARRLNNVEVHNTCGIDACATIAAETRSARAAGLLTYIDPPYPLKTRTRPRYKHELTDQQHARLIATAATLPGHVMVSTYPNDEYKAAFDGWKFTQYTTSTRGGSRQEWLIQNFEPLQLHDYSKLGDNKSTRLNINRRAKNIVAGIDRLPQLERMKQIEAVVAAFPDEAAAMLNHFNTCFGRNMPLLQLPRFENLNQTNEDGIRRAATLAETFRDDDLPGQLKMFED